MQLCYMKVICFTCRIIKNVLVLNYNCVTYWAKYAVLGVFFWQIIMFFYERIWYVQWEHNCYFLKQPGLEWNRKMASVALSAFQRKICQCSCDELVARAVFLLHQEQHLLLCAIVKRKMASVNTSLPKKKRIVRRLLWVAQDFPVPLKISWKNFYKSWITNPGLFNPICVIFRRVALPQWRVKEY